MRICGNAAVAVCITGAILTATPAPAQERECNAAQRPTTLPAVSALIDSTGLARELYELGPGPDDLVFSLIFTDSDSMALVRLLEPGASAEAEAAVGNALRPQRTTDLWAVRLRFRRGGITVERSVYCPPQNLSRRVASPMPMVQTMPIQVGSADRLPPAGSSIDVVAEAALAASGHVQDVKLVHSSGIGDLDDQVMLRLQSERFLPALLDGLPIPSWYRSNGRRLQL